MAGQVGGTTVKGRIARRVSVTDWTLYSCTGKPGPSKNRARKALKVRERRRTDKILRSDYEY